MITGDGTALVASAVSQELRYPAAGHQTRLRGSKSPAQPGWEGGDETLSHDSRGRKPPRTEGQAGTGASRWPSLQVWASSEAAGLLPKTPMFAGPAGFYTEICGLPG